MCWFGSDVHASHTVGSGKGHAIHVVGSHAVVAEAPCNARVFADRDAAVMAGGEDGAASRFDAQTDEVRAL